MAVSPLNRVALSISILGVAVSLTGCASYPLGMSEEEWQALPVAEQQVARQEQAAIDIANAEARQAMAVARAEEARAKSAAYQQALDHAPYGTRVQCLVEGEAYIAGQWHRMDTVVFDALEGRPSKASIFTLDGRYQTEGDVSFNGHRVALCDRIHGLQRKPERCATVTGTSLQLSRGAQTRIHADQFVSGRMACGYPRPHRSPY